MENFDQIMAEALHSAEELKERVGDWYFDLALVVGPGIYHHMVSTANHEYGHGLYLNQEDGLFQERYRGYRVVRALGVHDSFVNPAVISPTFPDPGAFHLMAGDFLIVRGDRSLYIVDVPEIYGSEFTDTGIEVFMTGDILASETEPLTAALPVEPVEAQIDQAAYATASVSNLYSDWTGGTDTIYLRYVSTDTGSTWVPCPDQREEFQPCEKRELEEFLQPFRRTDQKEERT